MEKSISIKFRGATAKVILYTSKTLANGEHPIMLRITKNGNRKYISINSSSPIKWWNKNKQLPNSKHPDQKDINYIISKVYLEYNEKIRDFDRLGKNYTIDQLIDEVNEPVADISVFTYFDRHINKLREEKRRKYAKAFNDTKQQLFSFCNNPKLMFSDIDYPFLAGWESWMRRKGMRETSMSVFFRTLRTLFNNAIKMGVAAEKNYPFKKFSISKFNTKTEKRAITKAEMLEIIEYVTEIGSKIRNAQNIFVFSYLNQGMNFIDIANLQWKNISSDNKMMYVRSKTKQRFNISLKAASLKILDEYRTNSSHDPEDFVFPILDRERHFTPKQVENRLHKVRGQVNENMKLIGKELGIDKKLTTYVARHSYATVLRRNGTSISNIRDAMGHKSESITEVYLDEFENDAISKANDGLI